MREDDRLIDEFGGLATAESGDGKILRQFKRKNVAAKDWIADLVENGYRKAVKTGRRRVMSHSEEGLFMSDEMQVVGALSIAPSISALLSELKLLLDNEDRQAAQALYAETLTADKNEVLDVVSNSICRLIAECYPDGLHDGYDDVMLSSAPFYDGVTSDGRSVWKYGGYLDTASWVFLAADLIEDFLNSLEKNAPDVYKKTKWTVYDGEDAEQLSVDEVRKYVRNIYYACIRVTCDCIVKSPDGKYLGWTFRKMKNEGVQPSLYFSYVASTVYLGLYKRFNGRKNVVDNMRRFERLLGDKRNDNINKYKYYEGFKSADKLERTLAWMDNNGFNDTAKFLRGLSEDEIEELNLLYNVINDGKPLSYELHQKVGDGISGSFTELKEASVKLANSLWKEGFGTYANKIPFKVNMAKGPCFEDGSLVDMSVVKLSSHNNAFFNNLFVIGIILNSAYDAELAVTDPAEYEHMLNIFQLAIQNTQRCYDEIESEGLLYKIDSYILDFSDKVDNANIELAKQLRRVNMSVVPLMPLMLKNNNLMSEYIVQYPQKQMTESLKDIIRNRKSKDGRSSWVWDKDGYNAITNYYYVDALISFYKYYEQYEEPLIFDEEKRRAVEAEAAEKAKIELEDKFNIEVKELKSDKLQLENELKGYRKVFKDFARLLINGLIEVVDEQLTEDKLIGTLSMEEKTNREAVISHLNSFNKDDGSLKLSSLVHLTEKLQVMSLLSMDSSEQLRGLLKNSGSGKFEEHGKLISDAFGSGGNSSKFMRNMIVYLMDNLAVNKSSAENSAEKPSADNKQ